MPAEPKNAAEIWHEKIWQEYCPLVKAICCRLLPRDEREDATQAIFLRAFASLETLRDRKNFGPWVGRIARNYCLNALRDAKNDTLPLEEFAERYQTESASAFAEAESKIMREQILDVIYRNAALRRPPWDSIDKGIFELYYGEKQLTLTEVAAILRLDYIKVVRYRYYNHILPLLRGVSEEINKP